jgi:hypothetical protein
MMKNTVRMKGLEYPVIGTCMATRSPCLQVFDFIKMVKIDAIQFTGIAHRTNCIANSGEISIPAEKCRSSRPGGTVPAAPPPLLANRKAYRYRG